MEYLDRPFIQSVYQDAMNESLQRNITVFGSYMRRIYSPTYGELRYRDSDMFATKVNEEAFKEEGVIPPNQELIDQFQQNKADVSRLLGYEPFEQERLADQPFLYSQLVSFLDQDEDGNDDQMRIQASISIVRGFLQMQNIDNRLAQIFADTDNLDKNAAQIKVLQETKDKLVRSISTLAAENCLSMKNAKNTTRGDNTFTGKVKKLRDMNLREAEINSFDAGTAAGMRQAADISNASLLAQLRLTEDEQMTMIAEMRETITDLHRKLDLAEEQKRILLRENLEIKRYCKENAFDITKHCTPDEVIGVVNDE